MKHKKFYNLEHANRYLTNSVIMINNKPAYIMDVVAGVPRKNFVMNFIYVEDYIKGKNSRDKAFTDQAEVDMNPVPLGLVPNVGVTYAIYRNPARRWKVGLSSENIDAMGLIDPPKAFNYGNLLLSKDLVETIKGNYPTFNVAVDKAEEDSRRLIAFSRNFAIGQGDKLFHRHYPRVNVGVIKQRKPVLKDEAFFLAEVLKEDMNEPESNRSSSR